MERLAPDKESWRRLARAKRADCANWADGADGAGQANGTDGADRWRDLAAGGHGLAAGGHVLPAPPGVTQFPELAPALRPPGGLVAAFIATPLEPPTVGLIAELVEGGWRVLVPAPGPGRDRIAWTDYLGLVRPNANLERAAIPPDEALIPPDGLDSFGGLDPPGPPDSLGLLGPEALAACRLVLAPALAVDRTGTRLGQGGGWYDRALAFAAPGALILAVCFDWEVWPADALPREPHDRPVDGVLSSQGVELFNRA